MCGIFGHTYSADTCLDYSRAALKVLDHRGPDSWGDWYDNHVYLGHTRLAILDLTDQASQPMVAQNKNYVISVNGEVYNFKSLRSELSKKHVFISESDSEVILHGYAEWGIKGLLNRLEGMYAFAVYDVLNKKIFLARDRVGIKPLYYHCSNKISWASELKALEMFHKGNLTTDYTAYYDFLTYRYVPTPKTIFNEIKKLEPGHYLEFNIDAKNHKLIKYWDVDLEVTSMGLNERKEQLVQLVNEAVSGQLVSDVPVGVFLSGGVDSSIITHTISSYKKSINSFCIDFKNTSKSEAKYAESISSLYCTNHRAKEIDVMDVNIIIDKLKTIYDEPFADTSAIPTFLLAKLASKECKVLLSGDGGDEIFAGYNTYNAFVANNYRNKTYAINDLLSKIKCINQNNFISRGIKHYQRIYTYSGVELFASIMGGLTKDEKKSYRSLWSIDKNYDDYWHYSKYYKKDLDPITRLQYLDFKTFLPDCILTKVDRASMAVSIEVRVPFLSTKIVQLLFNTPAETRMLNGELKGLVKSAYKNKLPDNILSRSKKGFGMPLKEWRSNIISGPYTWQEHVLHSMFNQERSLGL